MIKAMAFMRMAACFIAIAAAGCASETIEGRKPGVSEPAYTYSGLAGQQVAVMVFVDGYLRNEYAQLNLDTARALQSKLERRFAPAPEGEKSKKKEGQEQPRTTFIPAASVVRFQREHPEITGAPIIEVAPKLGATRVIYIEYEDFSAYSPATLLILKGTARATLRVVEVADGKARLAFEERRIAVQYPPNSPEGVPASDKINVRTIYEGTVDLLAENLLVRFDMADGK